jgi:NTE family protein
MKAFGIFEGGGAKGYAHIGALQAIEARGIELVAVAGSSIGAVIALLIAAGFTGSELFQQGQEGNSGLLAAGWVNQLNQTDWAAFEEFRDEYLIESAGTTSKPSSEKPGKFGYGKLFKAAGSAVSAFYRHSHLFNQIWTRFGLTDAASFRKWLDDAVRLKIGIHEGPILFRNLKIPLKVVAGDLLSEKMRVFGGSSDADLNAIDAVVASASYPLFFQPYPFQGSLYVDGGLLSNLPAWVFDDERFKQHRPVPTFGFRFTEAPILGRSVSGPPSSLPQFLKRLATTSIFGGQGLGVRAIEEYYAFDLAADIDTLAFHEIEEKAGDLVDAGRKGVAEFFDTQIGPSDPDDMETLLGVVANFTMQALDRLAKEKLSGFRAFIVIQSSQEFLRVAYSANAATDGDDRLRIRTNSPGTAQCLVLKEPVLTFVPQIPEAIRTNPFFKYEHAARPQSVVTGYAVPIFRDPKEWHKGTPKDRRDPIAALVIDSPADVRSLLQRPEFEDRLATYAQICGEYLRGAIVQSYGPSTSPDQDLSDLIQLNDFGFFVSARKRRVLFQDEETIELVERIDERIQRTREARNS